MHNRYFDIEDLTEDVTAESEYLRAGMHAEQFLSIHQRKIESIKQLAGRLPKEGEIFFLWTVNSFNAFTFIPYIIRECSVIEELVIATYSINIRILEALCRLIDRGRILKVDIFISDSIIKRLPRVNDHLVALVEKRPMISVRYAWNHAKISLIRSGDHHFVVEGSGNWGENAQHEQYVFLNSERVFTFRRKEITDGVEHRAI